MVLLDFDTARFLLEVKWFRSTAIAIAAKRSMDEGRMVEVREIVGKS